MKLPLVFLSLPLMGFSMCSKKTDGESLKRAQTACIQSVRGFLPEKANLVKTLDSTVETAALVPKYKDLPTEWAQVKAKPFIADGVDQKLEAIVSDSTLSNAEGDSRITGILEPTSFWKETCSVELKNAIQKCAEKFEFDSSDWKNCLNSSPLASSDWVGKWSPFFGAYQKQIRPKLKEVSAGAAVAQ